MLVPRIPLATRPLHGRRIRVRQGEYIHSARENLLCQSTDRTDADIILTRVTGPASTAWRAPAVITVRYAWGHRCCVDVC